jgi:hypothetical protein
MLTHQRLFSAPDEGRTLVRPWVKNPSVVTTSGIACDLTFFGRYPAAEYMTNGAPNEATILRRSTDGGLDHGDDKGAGYRKYLAGMTVVTTTAGAVPLSLMVMDYLMYYPLIPMEDVQEMTNPVTLTRHTDGVGVRMMLVEQFPYVGGITVRVTYTNSNGVGGRLTPIVTLNTQTTLGTIATSAPATAGCPGIFVPLQEGDAGVVSVESIEFFTADAGNLAIVLVYPLAPFANYETTNPSEWDLWRDLGILSAIEDENNRDAYLSMVCRPNGSLSGAILDGTIKTLWVEV